MRLLKALNTAFKQGGSQGFPLAFSSSGDMSQATLTSATMDCEHMGMLAAECSWAGSSPVGVLQLQGSVSGNNWFNVGSSVAVSGNTGCSYVSDSNVGYLYARVIYTKTSGTGTIAGFGEAKGF
jgi:hypothetical protein